METEAPVRDERDEEHADEMKADDDIKNIHEVNVKNVHEVNVSQPKNVEETHEGGKKVEGSQNVEASITESEKKTEDKENDTVVEEVKTEGDDDKSTVTPSVEVEKQVNAADTPEPPTEAVEKPAEDTEASKLQEKEPEPTKEPTVEETAIQEIEGKEESPVVSAAPSTSVGPSTTFTVLEPTPDAIITPSVEVNELKEVQVGALVPDVIEKKDFDRDADAGKEESMKEESDSAAIKVEAIHTTLATEVAEQAGNPETNVEEEKQEKTMEFKKATLSEKTKTYEATEVVEASGKEKALGDVEAVKEKKDESFEGDDATFVETSRDLDVVGGESNVNASVRELEGDSKEAKLELKPADAIQTTKTEGSGDKKEETVKADDQSLVEPTKEGGDTKTNVEAPEQKVIAKTSRHQSNNIISKVKQSIVKVRKAIVGKSPSSKTMPSKGKDESKEK